VPADLWRAAPAGPPQLGLATIPARVIDAVTAKDEILALQPTENLQRAELDPIDTAAAMVGFFRSGMRRRGSMRRKSSTK
jgi:hypothetical protein